MVTNRCWVLFSGNRQIYATGAIFRPLTVTLMLTIALTSSPNPRLQFSVVYTLLLYLIFYMLYQRGVDFCLSSLRIRSMPFLWRLKRFGYMTCNITASDLTRLVVIFSANSSSFSASFATAREKYSNLRNCGHPYKLPEYCTNLHKKSLVIFNHCTCTYDFFYVCEFSFNHDFAHC